MKFSGGKSFTKFFCVMTAFTVITSAASGQTQTPGRQSPVYSEYYTIDEQNYDEAQRARQGWGFSEASQMLTPETYLKAAGTLVLNLLRWNLHNETRPTPGDAYIRKLHFGRWINDPTDDTCMNTRAKVLVRESEESVTYRNGKECVVDTGKWLDPYSGNEYNDSRGIQIDHMVPLKHAYMAGAWRWDYKTRCLYANYLWYHNHLVPSSVRENTSKGDRAPDKYLPPLESYRCQYVKDWLTIKLIWRLNMTEDEVQAINDVVTQLHCQVSDFKFSQQDLSDQRQYMQDNLDYCMINKR